MWRAKLPISSGVCQALVSLVSLSAWKSDPKKIVSMRCTRNWATAWRKIFIIFLTYKKKASDYYKKHLANLENKIIRVGRILICLIKTEITAYLRVTCLLHETRQHFKTSLTEIKPRFDASRSTILFSIQTRFSFKAALILSITLRMKGSIVPYGALRIWLKFKSDDYLYLFVQMQLPRKYFNADQNNRAVWRQFEHVDSSNSTKSWIKCLYDEKVKICIQAPYRTELAFLRTWYIIQFVASSELSLR